jgi:hypothetical protein
VQRKKEAAQKQEHGLEISVALDKKHISLWDMLV